MQSLTALHEQLSPLDRFEAHIVRLALARPGAIHPRDEAALRYILSLARLTVFRLQDGTDVFLSDLTDELRTHVAARLRAALGIPTPDLAALSGALTTLTPIAKATRQRILASHHGRIDPEALERELTQRSLVLACGGGGGAGYGHLGAFALFESAGLRPSLLAGASMGSILGLFRARSLRFEVSQAPKLMAEVGARHIFRPYNAECRWTLPSAVRLALRDGIGPYFEYDGVPLRLRDLPIPLLITVGGIRRDLLSKKGASESAVPRATEQGLFTPAGIKAMATGLASTVSELARRPDLLRNIVLGESDETREFDVIDAVGFSSSVPGVLHYELGRDAPGEVERIAALMESNGLLWLTDGGVTDNVPARTAWRAVQRGLIGTRNSFIVALDGFSPRLSTPLWYPIQVIARENVKRSMPYAHHYHAFKKTLSPVELLPQVAPVMGIVESAKAELLADLPFIQRMMEPLAGYSALA